MPSKQPRTKPQLHEYEGALKPCPVCSKPSTPQSHPFCSKRCADVDLHRWLGGTYAIPALEADESEEDDEEEGPTL